MANSTQAASSGVSLLSILGATLVVLKALEKITLAWVWVLAPFWAPIALLAFVFVFYLICVVIAALLD